MGERISLKDWKKYRGDMYADGKEINKNKKRRF